MFKGHPNWIELEPEAPSNSFKHTDSTDTLIEVYQSIPFI